MINKNNFNAILWTFRARAKNRHRPVLACGYVEFYKTTVTFTCTDGYRLHTVTIEHSLDNVAGNYFVFDVQNLEHYMSLATAGNINEILIVYDTIKTDKVIKLIWRGSRRGKGSSNIETEVMFYERFPDIGMVIPRGPFYSSFELTETLTQNLADTEQVMIGLDIGAEYSRVCFKLGDLKFTSLIDVHDVTGDSIKVLVSPEFLHDAMFEAKMTCNCITGDAPIKVTYDNDINMQAVIMPGAMNKNTSKEFWS